MQKIILDKIEMIDITCNDLAQQIQTLTAITTSSQNNSPDLDFSSGEMLSLASNEKSYDTNGCSQPQITLKKVNAHHALFYSIVNNFMYITDY